MLALLTYSDADVNLKSADGMTALHLVAQVGGFCDHTYTQFLSHVETQM